MGKNSARFSTTLQSESVNYTFKKMDICFNSLSITAPKTTTDFILSRGFKICKDRDCSTCPQNFSFKSLIESIKDYPVDQGSLEEIWVNWVECSDDGEQQKLVIEFESHQVPPTYCIDAVVQYLKQQHLSFDLCFKYRLENEEWDGEISASSDSLPS